MNHKKSLYVALLGSLFALVFAIISTTQFLRLKTEGFERQSFCAISERINCDIVHASSYSEFLGIPIAWWGVAFYSLLVILAVGTIFFFKNKRASATFAWYVSSLGMLYSLFLAFIATFVLKVVCIECISMYIGTFLAFVGFFPSMEVNVSSIPEFTIKYLKSILGKNRLDFKADFPKYFLLACFLFFLVSISYSSIASDTVKSADKNTIKQMIEAHFAHPEMNIEINPEWPMWGDPKGKVVIVEFSDFQCPYCKIAALNIRPHLYEFKKNIRYYFVNFPLDSSCNPQVSRPMHPMGCMTAAAVICAQRFGNFWEYHDDIFRDQRKISKDFLLKLAENFGWDPKDFDACLTDPTTMERLIGDISSAGKQNISGTPTIFVNNKPFRFWRDPEALRAIIKEEIKRAK